MTATTGIAVNVTSTTIGAGGLLFESITKNGGSKGIVLNSTGSGPFTVTGTDGADAGTLPDTGTGGTLQSTTTRGAEFISVSGAISLGGMTFTNTATTQTVTGTNCGGSLPTTDNNLNCTAAIHLQSTSGGVNLTSILVDGSVQGGINGNTVSNLVMNSVEVRNVGDEIDENGVTIKNLSGTSSITGGNFHDNEARQLFIINTSGTLSSFNITNSTFANAFAPNGGQGVLLQSHNAGTTMTVNVSSSTFHDFFTNAHQVAASSGSTQNVTLVSSSFTNANSATVIQSSGADVTYSVQNNTMVAGVLSGSGAINVKTDNGGDASGDITSNTIGNNSVGSGAACGGGCSGMFINQRQGGTLNTNVIGNTIRHVDASGISASGGQDSSFGAGKFNLVISGNLIQDPDGAAPAQAISLVSGVISGDLNCLTATVGGTVVPGAYPSTTPNAKNQINGSWDPPPGSLGNEIILFRSISTATFNLPGLAGSTASAAATFVAGNNDITDSNGTKVSASGTFGNAAVCSGSTIALRDYLAPNKIGELASNFSNGAARCGTGLRTNPLVVGTSLSLPTPAQSIAQHPASIATKLSWTDYYHSMINSAAASSPQLKAVRQLWWPVLSAFSTPRSHFNPLRLFERPAAAAEAHSAKLASVSQAKPALKQSTQDRPARNDQSRDLQQRPTMPERPQGLPVRVLKSLAGGTVMVGGASGFTLPAGESVIIMFSVTVNSSIPAGTCTISNQGRVDYTGGPVNGVLTTTATTNLQIPPSLITCPSDLQAFTDPNQCMASVSFTTPSATGCPMPTVTCLPAGPYPKGTTLVTCTASNGVGSNTTCSFNVTVTDNQVPSLACGMVAAQSTAANASCQATVPDVRTLARAQVTDNCTANASLIITQNPMEGSTLSGAGLHPITVTVSDGINSSTCVVAFTVNDTTAPSIICGNVPAQSATANANCQATVPDVRALVRAQASDNCTTNASLTFTQSPTENSTISSSGAHPITVTVSDGTNSSNCVVAFTVNDLTPPTIICPANQVGVMTLNAPTGTKIQVNYPNPTVTDNCTGATFNCNPPSTGNQFPLGTTTVNCTASDTATPANTASCSFSVVVRTPRAAVTNLKSLVQALVPSTLSQAQANSLISYLELGSTHLEQGNNSAACTDLANFVAQCNALGPPPGNNLMNATQRDALISYVNKIRNALGVCGGPYSPAKKAGVFAAQRGEFYLKQHLTTGLPDQVERYGEAGDLPVAGDWDGKGIDSLGVYRQGVFHLRTARLADADGNSSGAEITVEFGLPGDLPVVGDWDGDGVDTIGVYRQGQFLLRNSNRSGPPDIVINFGEAGDLPLAGDWDGDGQATVGVYNRATGLFKLSNTLKNVLADVVVQWGGPGYLPVVGDWDGDGSTTIGLYGVNGEFLLRNTNAAGTPDLVFTLGVRGGLPVAGKWGSAP